MGLSRTTIGAVAMLLLAASAGAQGVAVGRRHRAVPSAEPSGCAVPPATTQSCTEGAFGDATPQPFDSLSSAEVDAIVKAAAAALGGPYTIAVVDRAGRVLAIYDKAGVTTDNHDLAVGTARTGAFFSHNMAPLSSRTVRFISGIHFPPGVVNAPNAALYGIENTNRGCDFNVTFNANACVPRARSINGKPCNSTDTSGCGTGIVTGKQQPDDGPYPQNPFDRPVNAGGIPLYRIIPPGLDQVHQGIVSNGHLVGGIGVVGISGDSQLAEFASVTGAFGALNAGAGAVVPVPAYPLPDPGNVFIDGIRLPFLGPDQQLTFNNEGLPTGLKQLAGTSPGAADGAYFIGPSNGGCAANGYLAGPIAGSQLSQSDVDAVVQRSIAAAKKTRAAIRLPLNTYARMVISVADVDGTLLAIYRMPDATIFSIDVAVAKARNVVFFSTNPADLPGVTGGTAVTNRTIGFGAQPLYPPGIDSSVFHVRNGPFYPLFLKDLANPCSQGSQLTNANQNGIVFFPGATPLYRNGKLVGGLGISGDGVEQDDYVTFLGAADLLPPQNIWADQLFVDNARLPMFKFPRHPEGVTECGGKPCS